MVTRGAAHGVLPLVQAVGAEFLVEMTSLWKPSAEIIVANTPQSTAVPCPTTAGKPASCSYGG